MKDSYFLFATPFFTLIETTPTNPNVVTHGNKIGVNRVKTIRSCFCREPVWTQTLNLS